MQTKLSPEFKDAQHGQEAESILRSCVHCGFCNATCPTYQLLGDELDGPRGRIYLIKEMLEGGTVGRSTQLHLDRCLTCLNCETTCPSGVQYGKLVGIGRALVDERVERPWKERCARWLLREGLTSPLIAPLLRVASHARGLIPAALRKHVPRPAARGTAMRPGGRHEGDGGDERAGRHERKVLLLAGCVQPALLPNVNRATSRVLDACGIEALVIEGAGCCGAVRDHLSDHRGGLRDARRNIDAWWASVAEGGIEAIVMNASACSLAVKQYGEALKDDPAYAAKAARISSLAKDLSELLPEMAASLEGKLRPLSGRIAFHAPCTLQHGQRLRGGVEAQLAALGFDVQPPHESHLCCGSAGTYSVLQPDLARELRDRKIAGLAATGAGAIASANVGCIQHLQSGTQLPVRHWVEFLDEALSPPRFLIVTADDFGLHDSVNEAIEQASRHGILTAASLMVGAPAAADAVRRARTLPGLRVGLHLVLADGKAVLEPSLIPGISDETGHMDGRMFARGVRYFALRSVRRQLEAEIRAQFAAFARTGLALDHVNVHKHFHLHPTVLEILLRVGREYGAPAVRIPAEPTWFAGRRGAWGARARGTLLAPWIAFLKARVRAAHVMHNDRIFGLADSGAMDEAKLLEILARLPAGITEIYLHPATESGAAIAPSMAGYRHVEEFRALLSPRVRAAIEKTGIARGGYADLGRRPPAP